MALSKNNDLPAKILIGTGALFLLSNVFGFSLLSVLWPLFVIIPGLPFLYAAMNGGRKATGLIFPGIIITGTGLLLMYQSITGHWESWAYAWTLYPVMVGMGLQFQGKALGVKDEVNVGKGMVTYGLMAFAGLALLFELLIFGGLGTFWSLALLGAGAYMLKSKNDKGDTTLSKRKNNLTSKPKRKNTIPEQKYAGPSADIDPDLQRKIDEALDEVQSTTHSSE